MPYYVHTLFTKRLDSVVADWGEYIHQDSDRKIYIEAFYLYYLFERGINPHIANIQPEGLDQFGSITTISMTLQLPEVLDDETIYVISIYNYEYIDFLRKNGFHGENEGGYIVFYK